MGRPVNRVSKPKHKQSKRKRVNTNRDFQPIPPPIKSEETQEENQTEPPTEHGDGNTDPAKTTFNKKRFIMLKWIEQHPTLLETVLTTIAICVATALLIETQSQVDEAQKQVKATLIQNDIIRDNTRKELKSYVNVSALPHVNSHHEFEFPYCEFLISVKNFGQTPAYQVRVIAEFLIGEQVNPPVEDTIDIAHGTYPFTLDKDREETVVGEVVNCTFVYIAAPKKNEMNFIIGKIQYVDVFDDTTIVSFRYRYIAKHGRWFTDYDRVETKQQHYEDSTKTKPAQAVKRETFESRSYFRPTLISSRK